MRAKILFSMVSMAMLLLAASQAAGQEPPVEPAHFHHVHLNVTDPAASIRFYTRVFGATQVRFGGVADALYTERSFILLNAVDRPAPAALRSGIWHIGWGGVDVAKEYEWWRGQGVDIHTPLSPLPGRDNYYFYISGPDRETIEINTMGHHRFAHVHLFAADVNQVCGWYADHLGLRLTRGRDVPRPSGDPSELRNIWMNTVRVDNVSVIVFATPDAEPTPSWWPDPPLTAIEPTRGRPIDHLAFSYREIAPVYERMRAAGVQIVEPPTERPEYGMRSFFVMGPERVLIEIVEAPPIPEGLWDKR